MPLDRWMNSSSLHFGLIAAVAIGVSNGELEKTPSYRLLPIRPVSRSSTVCRNRLLGHRRARKALSPVVRASWVSRRLVVLRPPSMTLTNSQCPAGLRSGPRSLVVAVGRYRRFGVVAVVTVIVSKILQSRIGPGLAGLVSGPQWLIVADVVGTGQWASSPSSPSSPTNCAELDTTHLHGHDPSSPARIHICFCP